MNWGALLKEGAAHGDFGDLLKERFINISPDAHENQERRFDTWLSGQGIPFVNAEAKADYQARATLLKDAIQLKKIPQRIPI